MKQKKEKVLFISNLLISTIIGVLLSILGSFKGITYTIILIILLLTFYNIYIYSKLQKGTLNKKMTIICVLIMIFIMAISSFIEIKYSYHRLEILSKYVHLGDKYLEYFNPAVPDTSKSITINFNLEQIPRKCFLEINAKDVDSDIRNGPIGLFINGIFIEYLNTLRPFCNFLPSQEHYYDFSDSKTEINSSLLVIGINKLVIIDYITVYGYDDVNISNISLLIK